jgi:predicted ABC-type ATPase
MKDQPEHPVETPQQWIRCPDDIAFEEIGQEQAEEAIKAARKIKTRVLALMEEDQDISPL